MHKINHRMLWSTMMICGLLCGSVGCGEDESDDFSLTVFEGCDEEEDNGRPCNTGRAGGGGGGAANPDNGGGDDANNAQDELKFVLNGLDRNRDNELVLIMTNCIQGNTCQASFEIEVIGEGDAQLALDVPEEVGALSLDCEALEPGEPCEVTLRINNRPGPGTALCIGRIALSEPASEQDSIPVCAEDSFGQCLNLSCP